MECIIIAAVASNRGIGRDGQLAYHISPDLRRFKLLTMGHTVVMGRKTFESLPGGALPGRRNIVITRNPEARFPGADTATSLEQALDMARSAGETEAFIIGGGQIYAQALPIATRLEITAIERPADNPDTYFPAIDPAIWTAADAPLLTDPKSSLPYRFLTYTRR